METTAVPTTMETISSFVSTGIGRFDSKSDSARTIGIAPRTPESARTLYHESGMPDDPLEASRESGMPPHTKAARARVRKTRTRAIRGISAAALVAD